MNNVRLWIECNLKPVFSFETTDDEAAEILRKRYAERIAKAITDILNEDEDVVWNDTEFTMRVAFYKPIIKGWLEDSEDSEE